MFGRSTSSEPISGGPILGAARRVGLTVLVACLGLGAQQGRRPPRARAFDGGVTFNKQIVRLFQQRCQDCHRSGGIAPFSLMTFADAQPLAASIHAAVQSRFMPPWKPAPGPHKLTDERRLRAHEIDLIARWVEAGAPEGDPWDLPMQRDFPDQWELGQPDLLLAMDEDYTPDPLGADDYRCFSIPTELLANKNIGAVEVRPGNRRIVHHVLLFPDPLGLSASLADADSPASGYECFGDPGFVPTAMLGGWAPGNSPQVLPEGVAISLTAAARVVVQVHYHPDGTLQSDRTQIGLHFSGDAAPKELLALPLVNTEFVIPPGAERHEVTAEFTLTVPLRPLILAVTPHMHLLGREIRLELIRPGEAPDPLVVINDWDFDWQDTYYFREPVQLPFGGKLRLTAVYDNSEQNPHNPNRPPIAVRWGPKTTDEMCLAFISFVLE